MTRKERQAEEINAAAEKAFEDIARVSKDRNAKAKAVKIRQECSRRILELCAKHREENRSPEDA